MPCHNCFFQNMPGTVACTRCGAPLILGVTNDETSYLPPRAGMLKGLRPIRYGFNRLVGLIPRRMGERVAGRFLPDSIVPLRYLAAAMLSILPGLGQLFLGRWKAALFFFCGWLGWGFVAVQMPVEWWGGFFFGMVVVWHAAAALEALGVREVEASIWRRVRCMALLLAITVVPYFTLRMHVGETWGFYRALFPVAAQGVAPLDILLVDRRRVVNPVAGDILLVKEHRGRIVDEGEVVALARPRTLAWLGAAGPCMITLHKEGIRVDGQPMQDELMPAELRSILPTDDVTFRLSEHEYLIMFPLLFRRQAIRNADSRSTLWRRMWQELLVVDGLAFEAKATAIWSPIRHRRHFREDRP